MGPSRSLRALGAAVLLAPLWAHAASPTDRAADGGRGPDQSVTPGVRVQLDGSRSRDPDGVRLSYAWAQVSGPAVDLQDPRSVRPYFTAPESSQPADLEFSLTVTDADGARDRDRVRVRVAAVNEPLTAGSLSLRTAADTPLALELVGIDPEGGLLRFEVQPPVHGSLSGEPPALTYTPATHYVGSAYRTGRGGLPPYTVEVAGTVPGLVLEGATLKGVPEEPGDFTLRVRVRDAGEPPLQALADYTLRVYPEGLAVVTGALPGAVVGAGYAAGFEARGGRPPYRWRALASLPEGLELTATGMLSGVPAAAGDSASR